MIMQIVPTPADPVEIVSVIDNVFDLLLMSTDVARRLGPGTPEGLRMPLAGAPLLESGECMDTLDYPSSGRNMCCVRSKRPTGSRMRSTPCCSPDGKPSDPANTLAWTPKGGRLP